MHALRRRLPRFAALVLLVWLFATGVAFAQSCTATIDLECPDCCAEMKASMAFTDSQESTVPAAPATAAVPPPAETPGQPAWQAVATAAAWPDQPDPGGSEPITIFFLRLAL